jgi:hypothetical protein
MIKRLKALLIITLGGLVCAAAAPVIGNAEAITYTQATNLANGYYSAVDCPHHKAGICKDREGYVLYGVGGGKWKIQTRGWECYSWEPCGLMSSIKRNGTRFYYTRDCFLDANGNRYSCSRFTDDG